MPPPEIWKEVAGTKYLYEVSNLGRVRSWVNGSWGIRSEPKILHPTVNAGGYLVVNLRKGRGMCYVHKLVLESFVGPCPLGKETLHGPLGKTNASLTNLSYGTRSENMTDCVRDGTDRRGEKHPLSKLTKKEVRKIRRLARSGVKQKELSRMFGVNGVSRTISGERWGHLA